MDIPYRAQLGGQGNELAGDGRGSMKPQIPGRLCPNQHWPREGRVRGRGIQALVAPRRQVEKMKLTIPGIDPRRLAMVHSDLLEHPGRELQQTVTGAVPGAQR